MDRPRYTHTSAAATFPFPKGMTPDVPVEQARSDRHAAGIETAARELHQKREAWLWPSDLFQEVPEAVDALPNCPGTPKHHAERMFPLRRVPVSDRAAAELSSRHLTILYNDPPPWLLSCHRSLDAAVACAYGWDVDIDDDGVLANFLVMNLDRSNSQSSTS
jgi:hypothetical protein